jgi:hypothetical protein
MSKTHCRFCDITVQGLYLNCPRCGKWLAPSEGSNTAPEPFELVEYGESWNTDQQQTK